MKPNELFERIAEVLPPLDGWCELAKANVLAASVLALRPPATVVEIGVFGGKSLIPMALACETIGAGMVIGIDPWSADASIEGQTAEDQRYWASVDHEAIYRKFLEHLRALAIESRVTIWRARSDDVVPPATIDLLHVDGQHTEQAVRDVVRFASNVRLGGLCCMDDTSWSTDVQRAVESLKQLGFVKLYDLGIGAMFQRRS